MDEHASHRPPRGRGIWLAAALIVGVLGTPGPAVAGSASSAGPVGSAGAEPSVARPSDGTFDVAGHGWGHGRGMSQYGAAQAAREGHGYGKILDFYYRGATLRRETTPAAIRVLLGHSGSTVSVRAEPRLSLWWNPAARTGRGERLPTNLAGCRVSAWRLVASQGDRVAVQGYSCGHWRKHKAPTRATADGRVSFVPSDGTFAMTRRVSGDLYRRGYRGRLRVLLREGALRPINVVPYDQYLRAVVPAESPASWPMAALRAQSVAARTYALRSAQNRHLLYFDVYDTTASQAYPGRVGYNSRWEIVRSYEHPRTNQAIRETRGRTIWYGGKPALTEFGSSNGGWTADGGVRYLSARQDTWDRRAATNSLRDWDDTISVRGLEQSYPSIGRLRSVVVLSRSGGGDWGGRVSAILLRGSTGDRRIGGQDAVRNALGLRSAWFTFTK